MQVCLFSPSVYIPIALLKPDFPVFTDLLEAALWAPCLPDTRAELVTVTLGRSNEVSKSVRRLWSNALPGVLTIHMLKPGNNQAAY